MFMTTTVLGIEGFMTGTCREGCVMQAEVLGCFCQEAASRCSQAGFCGVQWSAGHAAVGPQVCLCICRVPSRAQSRWFLYPGDSRAS